MDKTPPLRPHLSLGWTVVFIWPLGPLVLIFILRNMADFGQVTLFVALFALGALLIPLLCVAAALNRLITRMLGPANPYGCPICDHDIRMSPHRCPNCGTRLIWGQLPPKRGHSVG